MELHRAIGSSVGFRKIKVCAGQTRVHIVRPPEFRIFQQYIQTLASTNDEHSSLLFLCLLKIIIFTYRLVTSMSYTVVPRSLISTESGEQDYSLEHKQMFSTRATGNYRMCISKKGRISAVVALKSVKPPSRPKVDGQECPRHFTVNPLTTASLFEAEQMDCSSVVLLCG